LGTFRAELKAQGWIEGHNLVIENPFAGDWPSAHDPLTPQLQRPRVCFSSSGRASERAEMIRSDEAID